MHWQVDLSQSHGRLSPSQTASLSGRRHRCLLRYHPALPLHSRRHPPASLSRPAISTVDFGRTTSRRGNASDDIILSDRSGLDPLIYATKYGPPFRIESLLDYSPWRFLHRRMQRSVVVVCPPHGDWLVDDGVRLMPTSWEDWLHTHRLFCQLLGVQGIPFTCIPENLTFLSERLLFVIRLWKEARARMGTEY